MGTFMNVSTGRSLSRYSAGDVVVVPFPSSTGAEPKRRPAVILAAVSFGAERDYVVCLITSQASPDPTRITLTQADIQDGLLSMQSYLRPAYLYTASERLIVRRIGTLIPARLAEAVEVVIQLLQPKSISSSDTNL